jgi:hypothetical protein
MMPPLGLLGKEAKKEVAYRSTTCRYFVDRG